MVKLFLMEVLRYIKITMLIVLLEDVPMFQIQEVKKLVKLHKKLKLKVNMIVI